MAVLDWSVGQNLAKLRELQLDENTLVLFTSDNGPWFGGSAGGLRGMKGQTWEGGMRVPLIARWPGHIPADRVLHEFRSGFVGKCSPVHFFWGSFDLAVTRFSGRRAPVHPGGVPNLAVWVTREASSRECSSCGFWPGGGAVQEPAFYAYTYPEPPGYRDYPVRPKEAYYDDTMREHILPYEAVRRAADPDRMVLEFCRSTYEAGAQLGGWDRAELEHDYPAPGRATRAHAPTFPTPGEQQ